jgi:hypothetical protein
MGLYKNDMTTVVICRYNEDVSWTSQLSHSFVVYNKGEDNLTIDSIKSENIGREGESFLRYILDNYNNLPDRICFLQGNPFDHCPEVLSLCNDDSYFGFIGSETSCDGSGTPHHPGLPVSILCDLIGISTQDIYKFHIGGQMIVSKDHIHNRTIEWWKECYAHYCNNEHSPWVFERLWALIFNEEV